MFIQPESSLFLLLGSYHANNNSAQVKHCDISTFNPHRETFRSLEKYTQTKIINVSPYRVFSVFVCVCALNLEYIYLRSAEVMGFGSCVILFDLLLTYDEFCCTSNLQKNECGPPSAVSHFPSDRHIRADPYDNTVLCVSVGRAVIRDKGRGEKHAPDTCLQTENREVCTNDLRDLLYKLGYL